MKFSDHANYRTILRQMCFQVHGFLHVIRKNESTSWIAASNAVPGPLSREWRAR
jgi:hypothetical protein